MTAVTPAQPAGYSGTPLPKKLGIKPGARVGLAGAPDGFGALLEPLPDGARIEAGASITGASTAGTPVAGAAGAVLADAVLPGTGPFDVIVFFAVEQAELAGRLSELRARMAPAAGLWIAWPKRASRVPTDMAEDVIREIALPTGLVDNKVCAIDAVWSGLRLVIRRELR
ncbi:MAG TPA: hypothetical protein VGQ05_16400 [Streptosporangiaceae bacterium]|nr:hypothetical protein [Streptosporangiaceae bacterium]